MTGVQTCVFRSPGGLLTLGPSAADLHASPSRLCPPETPAPALGLRSPEERSSRDGAGGMEWAGARFHHARKKWVPFKTYKLFTLGICHLVFSNCD